VPEPLVYVVDAADEQSRLDLILTRRLSDATRSTIQEWIKRGCVTVDGAFLKPGHRVRAGERICLVRPDPAPTELVPEAIPLAIVYEDDLLVVVDKPAGMVVHPGAGNPRGTLANALLHHLRQVSRSQSARPGIVHRLDKLTSGLIVAAKDDWTHDRLARQFQRREVEKHYLALVYGRLGQESGAIDAPLGRDPVARTRISTRSRRPRPALTEYQVVRRWERFTFLRIILHTGRTHQIRVHLRHLGHPVVGDDVYGGKP
jgi:23S rRNA pseudouridine1911/1915/1917 synthase